MRRLSGLDASFLYAETPSAHMHTLKVLRLRLPRPARRDVPSLVARALAARMPLLPTLRLRLRRAPLSLGHPVWVEDRDLDPRAHLTHRTLGAGETLDGVVGAFASEPLDRRAPLWRMQVVEGLAPGELALVLKIHHALADGAAVARLVERVMGEEPPGPPVPPRTPEPSEPEPLDRHLAAFALRERARQLAELPPLLARTAHGLLRAARESPPSSPFEPSVFGGARTSFDRPLTPRRVVVTGSVPLATIRGIKARAGCRVNDVVLTVTAGALRRYLAGRGEPVDRPLVSSVPVGLPGEPHLVGNRVSNLIVPLHVEEPRPRARLAATVASARRAKEAEARLGHDLLARWTELARPRVVRFLWHDLLRRLPRPPVNVVVSNVPGPPRELWVAGAQLIDLHSVGPLLETTGLNLTFWSYAGRLNLCALACPDHGTDLPALRAAFEAAAREMDGAI
ncbi:MAG TPA: wax ester/triacylglycerol synthase family O-acyltransferase [Sandaracinaceae bacterium LLY-WYZ-13_1]|nr:wax ester/triacylglycerol synthase family O-acyltransferase [Sandaracinaceae bacterium LLY-WYZ-13_1]